MRERRHGISLSPAFSIYSRSPAAADPQIYIWAAAGKLFYFPRQEDCCFGEN
jgi:hypothetical protein